MLSHLLWLGLYVALVLSCRRSYGDPSQLYAGSVGCDYQQFVRYDLKYSIVSNRIGSLRIAKSTFV